jgi:hypothetical protein
MSRETVSQSGFICCEASSTATLDRSLCHLQDSVSQLIHADTDLVSPLFKPVLLVLRVLPYFMYCRHLRLLRGLVRL